MEVTMCDYSLTGIQNRLAEQGEELVVQRFPTQSVGLASPAAPGVAVCIPPGARLVVSGLPAYLQTRLNVEEDVPVVFTQASMEVNRHRDAVRLPSGLELLLQNLPEGVRVRVVSLGVEQTTHHEPQASPAEVYL
jgi:hypothetical protein